MLIVRGIAVTPASVQPKIKHVFSETVNKIKALSRRFSHPHSIVLFLCFFFFFFFILLRHAIVLWTGSLMGNRLFFCFSAFLLGASHPPMWSYRVLPTCCCSSALLVACSNWWKGLIFDRNIPLGIPQEQVKNGSGADIFHWVSWVILFKRHSVKPNIGKSPIGLIFCRSIPMGSLQGQLKMVQVRTFFIVWVIWGKLLKTAFRWTFIYEVKVRLGRYCAEIYIWTVYRVS